MNWWRTDCCYSLLVKLTFLRAKHLENFKPELFQSTLYFLQRLNHSSLFSNIYTKGELAPYGYKSFFHLVHIWSTVKQNLWHEVRSKEPGSEMKGYYIKSFSLFVLPFFIPTEEGEKILKSFIAQWVWSRPK